jgi:rRNA maturation protein Nop10
MAGKDFCPECREETKYSFEKRNIVKNIKGKDYTFKITVAICAECGAEMSPPGIFDKNVQEIEEQYNAKLAAAEQ